MLGMMGSGKSLSMVREIILNNDEKTIYSNIIIKGKKNCIQINRDMIIKKEIIGYDKFGTPKYKSRLNSEFWIQAREKYQSLTVVIDEAHTVLDSRRSMSTESKILLDFIALLRRVLGESNDSGYGELILISQLGRRIDIVAKELSTNIQYHKLWYNRRCKQCGFTFSENNETAIKPKVCFKCKFNKFDKFNYYIEKWEFGDIDKFNSWREHTLKTYHLHYFIRNPENFFKYYNTFQWDNMISEN